jgi:MarR family transcriptional regulator, transcriptional regulator for hemolysin
VDQVSGERHTLGYLLREASRLMRRHFIQRARAAGLPLNRSEAAVLAEVAHAPGTSQAVLAARLEFEPIALVRLLDRLQAQGLVERRMHAGDRRVRCIWPTKAAAPVVAQIKAVRLLVRADALAALPPEQVASLLAGLRSVCDSLAETGVSKQLTEELTV